MYLVNVIIVVLVYIDSFFYSRGDRFDIIIFTDCLSLGNTRNFSVFLGTVRKMGKTKANKTGQDKAYLHPKSRKAKHLSSFQAHNDKAKKAQDMKMARMQSKATKMMFFKERMEEMFLEDGKREGGC